MRQLRIAITTDPLIPVPPRHYGGIERVVDFVIRNLVAKGHKVTLFGHPESKVEVEIVGYGKPPHFGLGPRLTELWQLGSALYTRRNDFDVILSWGRLAALLPLLPLRKLPKIQNYCRDIVPWRGVKKASILAGNSISFVGASNSVYRERKFQGKYGGDWLTVYYGIEPSLYDFVDSVPTDAPLVFLGRIEPIKGTHSAIAIAKASGRRLVIAGNRVEKGSAMGYFEKEIEPHLDDQQITYIGTVDDKQKNTLLGNAAALLMPIQWNEAFGIVMAEAMACGTPVIAFRRGSVPEIVKHGVNGFVCGGVDEAVIAVKQISSLDRGAVNRDCIKRFSDEVIAGCYEQACYHAIAKI